MSRVENILQGIVRNDRVAGAYLFSGAESAKKREQAEKFAELLGCQKQDIFVVEPDGASVKIEQVRELQKWVRFGPAVSKYLVLIVDRADTLTDQAAGAFLKTLEEPAPGVVFILLVAREDKLPATILSRCQKIIFADQQVAWAKGIEYAAFYAELSSCLAASSVSAWLKFSAVLSQEKEEIEKLLYDLVNFCRSELHNVKAARVILDTIRFIKRRANFKLALDVMCLKLGEN
ncbi:MAG: hypothetical protein ABIE84_02655 [bacterium]